jgi:RimJ/RimL family protein N-acetyltransferase
LLKRKVYRQTRVTATRASPARRHGRAAADFEFAIANSSPRYNAPFGQPALAAELGMLRTHFDAAPVLETERLYLRGHQAGDFADCVAMWSEPVVVRYTIGDPSPASRTWLRMLGYRGHWAMLGFGYWAVEEKASGRYIGELGFADFKRDIQPSIKGMPELGWALAPRAHGIGYATEALQAVVAWGDRQFVSPRTTCIIHRDNKRSIRVADKLGFTEVLRAPTDAEPSAILVRAGSAEHESGHHQQD